MKFSYRRIYTFIMMKISVISILSVILLASCSTKFSFQKRKYRKGFYFSSTSLISNRESSIRKIEKTQDISEKKVTNPTIQTLPSIITTTSKLSIDDEISSMIVLKQMKLMRYG